MTKQRIAGGNELLDSEHLLKNILSKLNYEKLQKNVKIAQKELSITNLVKELESFYVFAQLLQFQRLLCAGHIRHYYQW